MPITGSDSELTATEWWRRRRPVYNIAIVFALVLGYIAYGVVLEVFKHIIGTPYVDEDGTIVAYRLESGGLESLVVCASGLIYLVMGNVCYGLGALVERIVHPDRIETYRWWAWRAGLVFSCLLPFSIAGLHLFLCIFFPGFYDHTPVRAL